MVAMTRAVALRAHAAARESGRRFIPCLPTLWPGMLAPVAHEAPAPFPLGAARVQSYYFARNAIWHGVRLLGLPGHEVLVPAYHHGVEVAALLDAGCRPRFVRVDGRMRLDLEDLERKIGPDTRAVYVIHYAGMPQPMGDVVGLARRAGLLVVEDCALALLSGDGERPLGSSGDIAVFCLYKTVPVPNGGVLVVNADVPAIPPAPRPAPLVSTAVHAASSLLANGALRFGALGDALRRGARRLSRAARDLSGVAPISTGTSRFDPSQVDLGMSPLTRVVLRHLDYGAIAEARRRNYFLLLAQLRDAAPPVLGALPAGACPLFYPLACEDKSTVQIRLAERGIETIDFWRAGHPACPRGEFPEVDALRERVLELPVHQDLEPEDIAYVARTVKEWAA